MEDCNLAQIEVFECEVYGQVCLIPVIADGPVKIGIFTALR